MLSGLLEHNYICSGSDNQSRKFDSCFSILKALLLEWRNYKKIFQIEESYSLQMEDKTDSQNVDWIEVRLERTPNLVQVSDKASGKTNMDFGPPNSSSRGNRHEFPTSFSSSLMPESKEKDLSGQGEK